MITPIFVLFFIISILFFFEQENRSSNKIILFTLLVSFILISAFRPDNMPDTGNYIDDFRNLSNESRLEIGYQYVRNIVSLFTKNYIWLFAVVCAIATTLKFELLRRCSPYIYGGILIYLSYNFVLQDMIQIRAGIASGFMLWAAHYIICRDVKRFLLFSFLAVSFHSSAAVILPMWFFMNIKLSRNVWLCVIPACYALAMTGRLVGHMVSLIPIESIQRSVHVYTYNMEHNNLYADINIYNALALMRVFICSYLIFFADNIEKRFKSFKPWLMMYTLSIAVYILCSDIPILAGRLSELLQGVEIFVIPAIALSIKERSIGKLAVIIIAAVNIYRITFVQGYLL